MSQNGAEMCKTMHLKSSCDLVQCSVGNPYKGLLYCMYIHSCRLFRYLSSTKHVGICVVYDHTHEYY